MTRLQVVPRSLRGRLTLALVALVTLGLAVLGVATTWITSQAVMSMVQHDLSSSMASLDRMVERSYDPPKPGKPQHAPKPFVEYTSQSAGTVIVKLDETGTVVDSAIFSTQQAPATLSPDAVAAIEGETWASGERREFNIPGHGVYLVESLTNDHGDTLIAAVSLAVEREAVALATTVTVGVGLVTLAAMALAAVAIIRTATRPLERVTETADHISRLELDHGAPTSIPRLRSDDVDDQTEAGRLIGALNRMLDNLDAALVTRAETDSRMRRFVTDASHELRTPLAAIQGYAELTRQESDVLPNLTESSLARIEAEADRMSRLVGDLLLLSRLDEGQGGLDAAPVDLCDLGLTALSDARTLARDHRFVADVPEEPVYVEGDHSALTQIVTNLLRNAHTHTPQGTVVTLRIRNLDDDYAELTVSDDGPGVEASFQGKLFERFTRVDVSRSRRAGSTGLGLAIVAALVEAHAGRVRYEDRPGGGSSFIVELPTSCDIAEAHRDVDSDANVAG